MILIATMVIGGITFMGLRSRQQKFLYGFFVLFFYLYNGFGIAYGKGVYHQQAQFYITFLSVFSLGYYFFLALLRKELYYAQQGSMRLFREIFENKNLVQVILVVYILISAVVLIYPEFKLHLLFAPPSPDVKGEFMARFKAPPGSITKAFDALRNLLFPFYLLGIMYFRRKLLTFAFFLLLPSYIMYCSQSYISRSQMLTLLLMFVIVQWMTRPAWRKYMVMGGLACLPLLPAALWYYQEARLGVKQVDLEISTGDAAEFLLYAETSFPALSEKVINSGKNIDLPRYFVWMFTLPIPKAIIGSVNPPSAGMEMSEILLGKKAGEKGFYALLAGLLTESVYIYGLRFYFVHAICIAMIFAFVVRLIEREPMFTLVFVLLSVELTYALNRAGIASALGVVVNMYFSFYVLFFIGYLRKRWKVI